MKESGLDEVCIIGLGYVGLTLAVAMADAGYRVHGVERSPHIRDCVSKGQAHFSEQGLDEHLSHHVAAGNITCSETLPSETAISVFIITVGTPLTGEGVVDLSALEVVLEMVADALKDSDTVILRSTVKIGTSRSIARRILDTAGNRYFLAFCPERTLEGKALKELSSLPQIVGGIDEESVDRAAEVFSRFAPKIIRVDTLETAEMVKLVNNTQRDLMFAFSNEIAEMCDAVGVSAMQVIGAACEDYPRSRIALPGPVGGPCLEKDPHILAEGLREVGYTPRISLAGRRLNQDLPKTSISRIGRLFEDIGVSDLGTGARVAILGLAFKGRPETGDLRGSMAEHILAAARARWPLASYVAFDPVVAHDEFARFDVGVCETLEEAFEGTSLVLIQNNHKALEAMDMAALSRLMSTPGVIYDYWNLFDGSKTEIRSGVHYGGLGTLASALTHKLEGSADGGS